MFFRVFTYLHYNALVFVSKARRSRGPSAVAGPGKKGWLLVFVSGLSWLVNRVYAVWPADVIFLFMFVYSSFLFLFFSLSFFCYVMFYIFHAFKAATGMPSSVTSQVKGYILKKGE